jgi:hypothetical protein
MPSTPHSQVPYPSGGDAPAAAADLMALAEGVDDRLVLRAADPTDRDARYPTPTAGMLVAGDDGTVWTATSTGAWRTVYEPAPPWVDCSLAAGLVAGKPVQARKVHDQVYLRGQIDKSDGSAMAVGTLAYAPAGMAPAYFEQTSGACSILGGRTYPVARLAIDTTGTISFPSDQDPGGGPQWISIDGIAYWIV